MTRFSARLLFVCSLACAIPSTVAWASTTPTVTELPTEGLDAILPPEGSVVGLLMGSALLESGDVQSALAHYGFLYRADPDNRLLAERFIDVALQAGHPGEALDAIDRLLEADEDGQLLAQKIRILLALGRAKEAAQFVPRMLELSPGDREARELQMSVWIDNGNWEAAEKGLRGDLDQDPDDADLHRRLGEVLLQREKEAEAEEEFRKSFALDPRDVRVVERLSDLLGPERAEELRPILEQFVTAVPDATVQAARLADLYLAGGDPEKAIGVLIPLVRTGTLEVRAEVVLAQLLQSMDRGDEAIEILEERAGESGTPSADRQRTLGELQSEAGRSEAAAECFDRALELDRSDGEIYASYLLLLSSPSTPDETPEQSSQREARLRQLADAALEHVAPGSLRQNFLVGAVLSRMGEYGKAVTLLEQAVELAPNDRRALYELALTQEQLEEDKKAIMTLESLLKLDPEDPEILNFYGYLLAENGWQLERAERAVQKALDDQPRNGAYLDSLGWVYFQQGRYEEALERIVDATNVLGDDPVILEHLGDCLRALGRLDDARSAYQRALDVGGDPDRLHPRLEELIGEPTPGP